jgi:hypothetical protein
LANVRGIVGSQDIQAGLKVLDVRKMIYEIEPNEDPLITVLGKMRKEVTNNTKFEWYEDEHIGYYTQINKIGDYLSTDVLLIVDDADIFQVNDLVKVPSSGEVLRVTAVDVGASTIQVVRGFGTTVAAAIVDDAYLVKMSPAMEEGYTPPEAIVTAKTPKFNYVQIFSKTVEITETANAVELKTGKKRVQEQNKKGREFKRDLESQFLWGEPKMDVTGAKPRFQSGGIYYFLKAGGSPALDMGGAALTETAFEYFLADVFLYDGADRIAFCGSKVLSQIALWATAKQRMQPGTTVKYGVKVKTYSSANGDVHFVKDRHFTGPHAGDMLIVKPEDLAYRFLTGLDMKLHLNQQPNGAHYFKDEYDATCGAEVRLAKHHGYIEDIGV